MDKSQPSTNSVSAMNLYRLGHLLLCNKKRYISQAKETVYAFESEMLQHPWLYGSLLAGVVTARLGFKRQRVFLQYVKSDKGRDRYYTTPRSSARALDLRTSPLPEHVYLPESGDEGEGNDVEKEDSGACTGEKDCSCCECKGCNCLVDRIGDCWRAAVHLLCGAQVVMADGAKSRSRSIFSGLAGSAGRRRQGREGLMGL